MNRKTRSTLLVLSALLTATSCARSGELVAGGVYTTRTGCPQTSPAFHPDFAR